MVKNIQEILDFIGSSEEYPERQRRAARRLSKQFAVFAENDQLPLEVGIISETTLKELGFTKAADIYHKPADHAGHLGHVVVDGKLKDLKPKEDHVLGVLVSHESIFLPIGALFPTQNRQMTESILFSLRTILEQDLIDRGEADMHRIIKGPTADGLTGYRLVRPTKQPKTFGLLQGTHRPKHPRV